MQTTALACVVLATMNLAAQGGTYVVNASGGAQFTDITAAVAAVPDGSVLIVRPGTYAPVVITARDVAILCDQGVLASGNPFLSVSDIGAGQRVVVHGLGQLGTSTLGIFVNNCAGRVALDGLGATVVGGCWIANGTAPATVRGYAFNGSIRVEESSVVLEACSGRGRPPSGAGLMVDECTVQCVRCSFVGATETVLPPVGTFPAGPGVFLANGVLPSSLRVMGRATDVIAAGFSSTMQPAAAIAGYGHARVEPAIPLLSSTPVPSTVVLTRPVMPSVLATNAPTGGAIAVTRSGQSNVAFAIAVSLPGPASWPSWLVDPVWLDPGTLHVEHFGVSSGGSPFQLQKPVPLLPQLRGMELAWQAIDFNVGGAWTVSNPSLTAVH